MFCIKQRSAVISGLEGPLGPSIVPHYPSQEVTYLNCAPLQGWGAHYLSRQLPFPFQAALTIKVLPLGKLKCVSILS